jgi:CHAT domain
MLVPKLARDVAALLRKRNVSCVVTNACRTAVSHERRRANLSQIFVQQGICAVSAMSSRICTTAVDLFYWSFYEALIMKGPKFAEAASLGRKSLRDNKQRKVDRSMMELQDWCVPVTYMRPERQQGFLNTMCQPGLRSPP